MTLIGLPPPRAPRTGRRARARRARHGARAAPCTSAARTGGPTRRRASASSSAAASPRTTWSRSAGTPAYFRRSGELGGARAGAGDAPDAPGEQLEVGVPHPRDVAPVGGPVVEDRQQVELAGLERERAQDLVRAGRVLDQQDRELDVADREPLGATERGLHVAQAGDDRVERDAEREAQRGGAERVVDVVEARQRQLDRRRCRPAWSARSATARVPSSSIRSAATSGSGRRCPHEGQR